MPHQSVAGKPTGGGRKAEDIGHGFGGHGHGSEGWRRLQAGTGRRCVRRVVEGRFPAMHGVLLNTRGVRGAWCVARARDRGRWQRVPRRARAGRPHTSQFLCRNCRLRIYANSKVLGSGGRKAQPAIEPPRSTSRHRATSRQRATSWHYVKREPRSHKRRISHLSHSPGQSVSRTSFTPRH